MKRMTMNKEKFIELCEICFKNNGLAPFCDQNTLFLLYQMIDRMLEVNAAMNLTAITEPNEIILKHLADSLTVAEHLPQNAKILDVGCGGGFPSLPLAIARPDLEITALDSTAKKTAYVAESAKRLSLNNVTTLTGRAEDLAQNPEYREAFDCTVARAVASLPVLSELCLPFIKIGGKMIAMKAKLDESEATNAPKLLGASPFERYALTLQFNELTETRLILIAEKKKNTPKEYPRAYAQIKKKPL